MIRNSFKIAWRNFIRDRQFSFLNLVGLSTGLACALLIFLWVKDERSIDKFNARDSQLFQVIKTSVNADGTMDTHETTPCLLAQSMANEIPEIEYAVAVVNGDVGILSAGNKHIKAKPKFADRDFFNVFSYREIEGEKNKLQMEKHDVFISDKLALKLFNTTKNITGKTVTWDGEDQLDGAYNIAGVFEAPPANASVQFDIVFTFTLYYDTFRDRYGLDKWYSNNPSTYVVLKKGIDVKQFNNKIKDFSKAKFKIAHGPQGLEWEGIIFLQRYSDKYLYNRYENGKQSGGRIEYVRLFSVIAIFILVIACINFMNLATARASRRIKEVGIKKCVGAGKGTLILQYMGESMLMTFVSLIGAILLVALALPQFRMVTGKELSLHFDTNLILSSLGIALITGLIAGSYPALYISGFRPAMILKGKTISSPRESWIRKGLVVFQFSMSVILIIAVLVVYKQMELIQTRSLGYNKDNIVQFANEGKLKQDLGTFLSEVKKIPGVINASSMDGDMLGNHSGGGGIDWPGKLPGKGIEFDGLDVDDNLMATLDFKMAEGRFFSGQFGSEDDKVIFNKAAVAAMGLKNPIGQIVTMWGSKKQIIGIVNDFHFESLHKKVGPFFFRFQQNNSNVLVKIKGGKEKETIGRLEKFYKTYNLGLPFEYKFLDDNYQQLYAAEQRVALLSRYFAGLAIIISCLGLFGLAAFTAQKRQKEIGIRKVVGASVSNIAAMLSKDFLKLVLIAVLIAFPLAWWAMNEWLTDFAYRITIGPDVFLITGASIILITLLTISFQSIKAALANPVKSLRTE
ncbi:MAG TPA: ABC transporter permease [Chitinophagaceae bacterium]|nr:ABC transporter permease [Chitinophagaceae bacterium]